MGCRGSVGVSLWLFGAKNTIEYIFIFMILLNVCLVILFMYET